MKNRAYDSAIKRSPYEAMFGCPANVGLSSSIIPQSVFHSINTEEDLEKLEDLQEIVIMESQLNLTQEDIPLSLVSTELPYTSKESPWHVEEVITELPSTITESPSQFRTKPVKRTVQKNAKAASSAHKCKFCDMFVHIICGEIDPKEEGYGKNVLCNICKKNMDQKTQHDKAKKGLEKQAKKMLVVSNAKHPNVVSCGS